MEEEGEEVAVGNLREDNFLYGVILAVPVLCIRLSGPPPEARNPAARLPSTQQCGSWPLWLRTAGLRERVGGGIAGFSPF